MQKKITNCLRMLLMMVLFSTALWAQETPIHNEKKVVVTITGTDAKGAKITKRVIKTGKDAETFDVEKYINENLAGLYNPVVQIGDEEDKNEPKKRTRNTHYAYNFDHKNEDNTFHKKEQKGFLGVSQKEADSENTEGVSVNITRNSGAAKAGLKEGDVLLQLNNAPIKTFQDISVFMRTTKPNDKIQVKFKRAGETQSITAAVGQPEDAWENNNHEKEACLGVYTSTFREDGQRGAAVRDFTPISAAKEEAMQVGDVITAVNGIPVKSHQEVWDEIAKYKPKQMVWVSYLRNKAPLRITASLKACKPAEEKVIVVPEVKADAKKIDLSEKSQLKLENFSTFPNPIQDMVNIKFQGEAVPTTLSFYDLSGRVLFQQTLTDFSGNYDERFDLSAYAKGIVVVRVLQGEKVFAKQIVVN